MKFYEKDWFVILMLFLFFPVGLFLMWKYKKEWSTPVKGIITGCIAVFFLVALFTPSQNIKSDLETEPTSTVTETQATTEAETTTEAPTEAPTQAPTTAPAKPKPEPANKPASNHQGSASNNHSSNKKPSSNQSNVPQKPKPQPNNNPDANVRVYYTKTGECYHYINGCGNGTYYPTTLEEAKKMGLRRCEKCGK